MTNISKKVLNSKQEAALADQFFNVLAKKPADKVETLLVSLLGYEEKLMIVKRFAVIIMLWRKCTKYEIAQKLRVSTSTVSRIEDNYRNNKYADIITMLENKGVSVVAILEGIDSALHLGGILPHYGMTHKMEDYKKYRESKRKKKII